MGSDEYLTIYVRDFFSWNFKIENIILDAQHK